jgi:hypothetical protein
MERKRRINVLQELDAEQEIERQARRRWAIKAIEQERAERISAQFLSTLSSTNWFNETITDYHEDYELVCPYYKLGCRVSCRRGTIGKHLKKCRFALELVEQGLPETPGGYEVVCPNSILGCTYIGNLDDLHKHLTECSHAGQTVQQEIEERLLLKQHVIRQQEEERARRVRFDENVIVKRVPKLSAVDEQPEVSAERLTSGGRPRDAAVARVGNNNSTASTNTTSTNNTTTNTNTTTNNTTTTNNNTSTEVQPDSDVSDVEEYGGGDRGADMDSSENSDGGGGRPRGLSRKKALLQRCVAVCVCMCVCLSIYLCVCVCVCACMCVSVSVSVIYIIC